MCDNARGCARKLVYIIRNSRMLLDSYLSSGGREEGRRDTVDWGLLDNRDNRDDGTLD